jgi:hypothetical protein
MKKEKPEKQPEKTTPKGKPFAKGNPFAFQKGQSGNPKGRPKVNLTSILREHLQKEVPDDEAKRTYGEAIVDEAVKKAAAGDLKAIEMLWSRLEGKPEQTIELTSGNYLREHWLAVVDTLAAKFNKPRTEVIEDLCTRHPEAAKYLME